MKHRIQRAWLNDVEFTDVHPALILQHINEGEPKINHKVATRPGGGLIELARTLERREIILEFAIREGLDFSKRQEVLQAVNAWAWKGGWLELSDHPGQHIFVSLTKAPVLGRLREWTNDLSMTFTAVWYPFWLDMIPQEVSITNSASGSVNMQILGSAPSCLCCDIIPVSTALNSVSISTTNSQMGLSLTSAPVSAENHLMIEYDNNHLLKIYSGSTSLLQYRSGADDLIVLPGYQSISYSFDVACNATFRNWGVWI